MTVRRLPQLLLALLASACAMPSSLEKGGLSRVRVDPANLEAAQRPVRRALLIGVGEYDDPAWRDLRYAEKDARDLAAALQDPARGAFDEVEVLVGAARTRREAIRSAVRRLGKAKNRDDILLVFVSAHGTLARDERGELRRYLVGSDTQFGDVFGTALSMDDLEADFGGATSSRRVLVLATCHSGAGKSLLSPELTAELGTLKAGFFPGSLEGQSRASIVLSASDWGESAREDDTLQNDIYTHFFIEALAGGADRDGDGAVSATEAHDFARRRTFSFTEGRQRASAQILEVGADPVFLSGHPARPGRPELYSYSGRLEGFTVRVDGEVRGQLPGGLTATPGDRSVELSKGGKVLFSEKVSLAWGQKVALDELLATRRPRRALALGAGLLSLADQSGRRELMSPTATFGLEYRQDDLWPGVALHLDASMGGGEQHLALPANPTELVPFQLRTVGIGVAATYRFDLGAVSLLAGLRVAGLHVTRSFQLDGYQADQRALLFQPGGLAMLILPVGERVELLLRTTVSGGYLVVDGEGRLVGFGTVGLGAGVKF